MADNRNALRRQVFFSSVGGETGLSKSEEYRRFARECLQMADEATDRRVHAIMIHMAQVWVRLAQEYETPGHEAPAELQSDDG